MDFQLGALKERSDIRDYQIVAAGAFSFPQTFIIDYLPKVKNQGSVNSCVAHATSTILEYFNKKEINSDDQLSTDFIYGMQGIYLGRKEPGMYLRDACKIVKEYGDPRAKTIGTNIEQPRCSEKLEEALNDEVYAEAAITRVKSYARCKTENEIKHALMNYGPLLGSIKWYNKYNFEDKVIHMDTTSSFGYHAIMICGWNEKGWICQNSWGTYWGNDKGRFIYPFEDKLEEAWSFVDASNGDVYAPKKWDWLAKLINFIINLFN